MSSPVSTSRWHEFRQHAIPSVGRLHGFSWQGSRTLNWIWVACSLMIPNPASASPDPGLEILGPTGNCLFQGELRLLNARDEIVHSMPLHFVNGNAFPEGLAVVLNDHRHPSAQSTQPTLLIQDPVNNLYAPAVCFYLPARVSRVEYWATRWTMDLGAKFCTGLAVASLEG